jgi:hypothetical protein
VRVYNINENTITQVYTWTAPNYVRGIVFFPSTSVNNAIINIYTYGLQIINVASSTSISTVYTLSYNWDFYYMGISPSGTRVLTEASNQNSIMYLIATTTSLTVQQTL